ncbi:MAG TPA: aldo/keto reductase [Terriglobales bacterium]|nr:aldo/keto reductase [Terriglobales bacterium]
MTMRHVEFAPLSRTVSVAGFGCASLGSRVDAKRGTAALARAFDAGITWFDVAPSYGDGQAEVLLGKYLASKRSQVVICTKVGYVPGRVSLAMQLAKPLLQRALILRPQLRKFAIRFRPPAKRVELTGAFIEASIVESLRRLQTDYVDVIALHEATLDELQRDDVLRALDDVTGKGYARAISLAGDVTVALAAVAVSERFRIVQLANNPFVPNVALAKQQLPANRTIGFVTHSVYGHQGSLDALAAMINKEASKRALMDSAGYSGTPRNAAAAFLLDWALASNPDGVVLLSMYQPQHLRFNLSHLTTPPPAEVVLNLAARLTSQ